MSPTILLPIRFIPTSIITALSLTISVFKNFGFPIAHTIISACFVYKEISFVLEWQTVTVAFLFCKSLAAGVPTIFERPITTTFLPSTSIL